MLVFYSVANYCRLRDFLGHGKHIYVWFFKYFIVLLILMKLNFITHEML